jgi:hypothetical protein
MPFTNAVIYAVLNLRDGKGLEPIYNAKIRNLTIIDLTVRTNLYLVAAYYTCSCNQSGHGLLGA